MGAILAAVPVSLSGWYLLIQGIVPGGAPWIAVALLVSVVTSGLVLGGWIQLAGIHPRWSIARVLVAYAIGGLIVWGVFVASWGGPDRWLLGLGVALVWPAGVLLLVYVNLLGLVPPEVGA